MKDATQPSWVAKLFGKAQTDREILDVIVSILKEELKYGHDDFSFIKESGTLLIRGVVAATWDRTDKMFSFGFSVTTEILGAVVLVSCLHLHGVHNIKFQQNFYISEYEQTPDKLPIIYYGDEAQKKYGEALYYNHRKRLTREMFEDNILNAGDGKQTYH